MSVRPRPQSATGYRHRLRPALDLSSGYVQRALPFLPKQGTRQPWIVPQNYVKDRFAMRFGRIDEDLELRRNGTVVRA